VDGADAVDEGVALAGDQVLRGAHQELQRLVGLGRALHAEDAQGADLLELDAAGRDAGHGHEHVEALHARRQRGRLPRGRGRHPTAGRREPIGDEENPHGASLRTSGAWR